MIFLVEPYTGAGPIRLGMRVEEIEAALGQRSVAVDKGGECPVATFPRDGVHAEIAADGRCTAIELMAPAIPVLDGQPLLGPSFAEVRAWLAARDPRLSEDGSGVTSDRLGVGLYAPAAAEDPGRPAEGAIIFEHGYYQDQG